ncbi:MAG: hypothetical protein KDC73_07425 [Ignavibacteriae bacterium]|nr:hypothetical protein [Ignavibacteriota bacterium]MCB9244540.1 hypothetical protein [Ignavibacteriales bacterium]
MENIKLIKVLRSFDSKEMKRFGEFISSPYFNRSRLAISLFESLERYYPEFKNRNLTIEKIFAKIFPKQKYDYHKINNVISDLYKLAEKFLAQMHFEKGEYYLERNVLMELRLKKLFGIYEQKMASYTKKLIERKAKDEDYFYYLYELNDEYLWYATIKKPNTELNILQTEFDHFLRYAVIRLLRFYNLMLHERNQNNYDYNLMMADEMIDFLDKHPFSDVSIIEIYKTTLLLLKTKEKKYYDKLWKLKEKHFKELNTEDARLMYIHLYDFAAYMVNFKGEESYNKDMFAIYKEMLEEKFITPQSFHYADFMNVIKIACRNKEFAYAKEVLSRFEPFFPENEKVNVSEFCHGTIKYCEGDLKQALEHFSKTNFQNFIFKVQVKILLLKIYYTLGMTEQVYQMVDTFKHYVAREKNLLQEHRDAYIDFLNCMVKLNKIKSEPVKDHSFEMKKLIKEADNITYNPFLIKSWLLEEVNKRA